MTKYKHITENMEKVGDMINIPDNAISVTHRVVADVGTPISYIEVSWLEPVEE